MNTINQLIANYIHQKNSNKNITIKKLPTQTNPNKTKIYQNDKAIKTRRKPRYFNTNRNNFDFNDKKLKSYSKNKNIKNNQKVKNIPKYTKTNMNKTICADGYGNIISNIHDRNLSAPSLNYENNHHKQVLINKKKKNNNNKLNKDDKKINDKYLINRDNYKYHVQKDINSFKDNNHIEINDDRIFLTNNNNEVIDKYLEKHDNNTEYSPNIHKNNLNINNFYKNLNNKKKKDYNDNSKVDISAFIKNIEAIKNKKETISLLKEQLKQDYNTKLNKTINASNVNQINYNYNYNYNNKNKNKKVNIINLVDKSGYALSNFHNYNKYTVNNNKNKNKININKNNNIYLNELNNISNDSIPNKQFENITKGNLINSNNSKTTNISNNITNNYHNFGKKMNLADIYAGQNNKEEKKIKENKIKDDKKVINKSEDNINMFNNELINANQLKTGRNRENNSPDIYNVNEDFRTYRTNNYNLNDIFKRDSNKNYSKNAKNNNIYLQKQNKNKNMNDLNKGYNPLSLNIKNKQNFDLKRNNKSKEKKGDNYNITQLSVYLNNNKKKYTSKQYYNIRNNDMNIISSRFNTISSERNHNFNNKNNQNKNKVNDRDKSFDIVNNKKDGFSKIKQNNISKSKSKSKAKYKIREDSIINKKNSHNSDANKIKPFENISDKKSNQENNNLKSKSIFKIGVICEPGEAVFGEKKINQDNYFNSLINEDIRFIGVCDGHGDNGHHVSKFLRNYLPKQLEKSFKKLFKKDKNNKILLHNEMSGYYNENKNSKTNLHPLNNEHNENDNDNIFEKIKKVFEKSFSKTDKKLSKYCQRLSNNKKEKSSEEKDESFFDVEYSGSTCVSIILEENNINKIYIANVGDSRAIIIKEIKNNNYIPYQISRDHKPTEKDEAQRVLDYDGEIEKIEDDDGNWTGPLRVWVKGSDGPGLAMTRSFGDEVGASVGVVSVPEVGEYKIKEEDKAIIIASDGLWEYMSNEEVCDVVKTVIAKNNPDIISEKLYEESLIRWRLKDTGIDDITIICILLKDD